MKLRIRIADPKHWLSKGCDHLKGLSKEILLFSGVRRRLQARQQARIRHSQVPRISCKGYSSVADPGLRIRDVYSGSEFFFHTGSWIQGQKDSRIRIHIKEFKYFNPKNCLSSRKYDPGCSSRIRISIFHPYRSANPVVKKAPDLGFRTRNTGDYSIALFP